MKCQPITTNPLDSTPLTPPKKKEEEENIKRKKQNTKNPPKSFPSDLSTKPGIAALAAHLTTHLALPHLDILISNAGIRRDAAVACDPLTADLPALQASMWSHREGDWADSFAINTTAHYFLVVALVGLLAAAAGRRMVVAPGSPGAGEVEGREEGRGVVVVTSSCASLHNCTNVDLTSYAASKAATDHLVGLLAAKFARWYVRVCGVNPGCEFFLSFPRPSFFSPPSTCGWWWWWLGALC